jgi:hypothetical protein
MRNVIQIDMQSFIAETDTAGDRRKAATASTMQSILFETNEKHEPGKLNEDGEICDQQNKRVVLHYPR